MQTKYKDESIIKEKISGLFYLIKNLFCFFKVFVILFKVKIEIIFNNKHNGDFFLVGERKDKYLRRYGHFNLFLAIIRTMKSFDVCHDGVSIMTAIVAPPIRKTKTSGVIEITNRCPHNCNDCYISEKNRRSKYVIDEETFHQAIRKLSNCAFIYIQGGEPLARDTEEMLQRVLKNYPKQAFVLVTSGHYISTNGIGSLRSLHNIIYALSINGGERLNDSLRFKKSYQYVMNSFDILKKERKYYTAIVTVSSANKKEIFQDEFVINLAKKGVKDINYILHRSNNKENTISLSQYRDTEKYAKKYGGYLFTSFISNIDENIEIINPYGISRVNRTGNDENIDI